MAPSSLPVASSGETIEAQSILPGPRFAAGFPRSLRREHIEAWTVLGVAAGISALPRPFCRDDQHRRGNGCPKVLDPTVSPEHIEEMLSTLASKRLEHIGLGQVQQPTH